jgi:hypothetical protein
LETLKQTAASVPELRIKSIESFKYKRIATLEQLIERARAKHYSTFCLYSPDELEEAVEGFAQKISKEFNDTDYVHWSDENTLITVLKEND